MWYDWLNKSYSFYMTAIVFICSGCDLRIEVHRRKQPNKTKITIKQLYTSNKMEHFNYKSGNGVREFLCIKVLKRTAGLGYRYNSFMLFF